MKDYESINIEQQLGETDSFTKERYRQFFRFFPKDTSRVLDIGCSTGRGGAVLKALAPQLEISGIDVVKSRLDQLPQGVYDKNILGSWERKGDALSRGTVPIAFDLWQLLDSWRQVLAAR